NSFDIGRAGGFNHPRSQAPFRGLALALSPRGSPRLAHLTSSPVPTVRPPDRGAARPNCRACDPFSPHPERRDAVHRGLRTFVGISRRLMARPRKAARLGVEQLESRVTPANVPILSGHYDGLLSGANTQETVLTPATVNPTNFGNLFNYAIDGYAYAQP